MDEEIWTVLLIDEKSRNLPTRMIDFSEEEAAGIAERLLADPNGVAWCLFFATEAEVNRDG